MLLTGYKDELEFTLK